MQKFIIRVIDTFYFLFAWLMPIKTYRYAVCGGSNLVFDISLYFFIYNFVIAKRFIDLGVVVLSPHIATLFIVFPITFLTGFLLQKYVTFQDSNLPGRVQFFRYFMVGLGSLLISYASMKLLVEILHFYPTPSRLITIIITVIYGYILQTNYSFKVSSTVGQ
jgi:putative flippase GtrA